MVSGWLNHKQLQIIMGVGKTPTDNFSAENNPVVVNLLSDGDGISLADWSPNLPTIKNGGVWAESPITDGRQLLSAARGNVTESMTLILTSSENLGAMKLLDNLNNMAQNCSDFWQTQAQVDPVYLMWYVSCGAGPQYALLYNIDLAADYMDGPVPMIQVSAKLEREPYWRGIPPGANPKLWTFYVNSQKIGANKPLSSADLISGSDSLINQTVSNKFEWVPAGAGLHTTPLTQNYISIPGSLIPGDAPALVEISSNSPKTADLFVARSTKKFSGTAHDGILRAGALNFNAGDADSGLATKTAGVSGTAVRSNGSAVTYYYGSWTRTGVIAAQAVATWGNSTISTVQMDREYLKGSFAIFCRCQNTSAAPTLADMSVSLLIKEQENVGSFEYSNSLTLPAAAVPIDINGRQLVYLGSVTFPFSSRSTVSTLGYGIELQESANNYQIQLLVAVNVATANRIFEFMDVIFMPIDECMAQVTMTYQNPGATGHIVIDSTGYISHGNVDQVANSYITRQKSGSVAQEVRGQAITLVPKKDQRLYFLNDEFNAAPVRQSFSNDDMDVRINIVPRWAGIRDV